MYQHVVRSYLFVVCDCRGDVALLNRNCDRHLHLCFVICCSQFVLNTSQYIIRSHLKTKVQEVHCRFSRWQAIEVAVAVESGTEQLTMSAPRTARTHRWPRMLSRNFARDVYYRSASRRNGGSCSIVLLILRETSAMMGEEHLRGVMLLP